MRDKSCIAPMLGFFCEDRIFVKNLASALRAVLSRPDLHPESIYNLAKLIFALERFPRATPGLSLELSLGRAYGNGEIDYLTLFLDQNSFRLGKQAYVILDRESGGDSTSVTDFEVHGPARELEFPTALLEWVEEFGSRLQDSQNQLRITDAEEKSDISWDAGSDDDEWYTLETAYP